MIRDAVLITGVGKRLGHHMARRFLARGTPVVGTFRTEYESLDELRDQGAELIYCDFYDDLQIDSLVNSIKESCLSLRAIIHNASDWTPDQADCPALEIIHRMMQVHVNAPYRLNLALTPLLENSTCEMADIIHVGDYVSSRGSRKHIAYAASKAAQDNLTCSFAARLAPRIKVNSVAPALICFNDHDDDEYREKARLKNLMNREGSLDEFQRSVDYLLESSYITGRVLPVDGGRHLA